MSPTQYGKSLVAKLPRCREIYDEYVMKRVFIEEFHESFRHSVRAY